MRSMTFVIPSLLGLLACGNEDDGYSSQRCDDLRAQIMASLEANVNSGVLIGTAIPCGENGIANRPDYFDSRVASEDIEYLQGAFSEACAEYEANC